MNNIQLVFLAILGYAPHGYSCQEEILLGRKEEINVG